MSLFQHLQMNNVGNEQEASQRRSEKKFILDALETFIVMNNIFT